MSFPTLSKNPSSITGKQVFNTISIEYDGGYKQTRERNTRDLNTFTVVYSAMSEIDKNLLLAHYSIVRGSTPFTWTNADNTITYTVRYGDSVEVKADATMPKLYAITLKLEEV